MRWRGPKSDRRLSFAGFCEMMFRPPRLVAPLSLGGAFNQPLQIRQRLRHFDNAMLKPPLCQTERREHLVRAPRPTSVRYRQQPLDRPRLLVWLVLLRILKRETQGPGRFCNLLVVDCFEEEIEFFAFIPESLRYPGP